MNKKYSYTWCWAWRAYHGINQLAMHRLEPEKNVKAYSCDDCNYSEAENLVKEEFTVCGVSF